MKPIRILAVETSTDACSAALCICDEIRERFKIAPRAHAALLLPFVEELLQEAGLQRQDLDAVAFGRGPGSFTGLRIAAGMAQGIAFGAGLPVIPVSTLAALAQACAGDCARWPILAALDARMGEVYFGTYGVAENGLVTAIGDEVVCAPSAFPLPQGREWCVVGDAWRSYAEVMLKRLPAPPAACQAAARPRAGAVARLAAHALGDHPGLPPAEAAPVYLRNNVAVKPGVES